MTDEDNKSTRVTRFDGKEENYKFWEQKYVARAYIKHFHGALMGTVVVPIFGTDYDLQSKLPDDKMQARIDENLVAYSDLINAIDTTYNDGKTAFTLVMKSVSQKYPNGNAFEGFKNLHDEYTPTSEIDHGSLIREFYATTLESESSVSNYLTTMELKRKDLDKLGTKLSESDFLHVLLNGLGKDFADLAQQLTRMINAKNEPLTVKILKNELETYIKRTGKTQRKYSAQRRNPENVLVAFNKPFKGVCNRCGKRAGHKAVDCNEPANNNAAKRQKNYGDQRKFTGTCHYCHKQNHKAIDCRKRKADEAGNVAIDGCLDEMVFSALDHDAMRDNEVQSADDSANNEERMATMKSDSDIDNKMHAKSERSSSSTCCEEQQQNSDSDSSQDWESVRRPNRPEIVDFDEDVDRKWLASVTKEFDHEDQAEALKLQLQGVKHQLEESMYNQLIVSWNC